jgi:hypothetical protein
MLYYNRILVGTAVQMPLHFFTGKYAPGIQLYYVCTSKGALLDLQKKKKKE